LKFLVTPLPAAELSFSEHQLVVGLTIKQDSCLFMNSVLYQQTYIQSLIQALSQCSVKN